MTLREEGEHLDLCRRQPKDTRSNGDRIMAFRTRFTDYKKR
jgi:hypothetical protein